MIIDTHCHAGINWFEPIENLIYQMDSNQIEKAVLIQHKGSTNDYLYDCKKKYSEKFSIVASINWDSNFEAQLNEFTSRGVSGVRVYLNFSEIFKNKGNEFFQNCSERNLVISLASNLETFSSINFKNVVLNNNDTIFVIEHLASAGNISLSNKNINDLFRKVLSLSNNDNLYMKIPGLGELNMRPEILNNDYPFTEDKSGLIKKTLNSFSSNNLMWGSDYPPVSNREGYRNSLNGIYNLSFLNKIDRENIFRNVPEKLFF